MEGPKYWEKHHEYKVAEGFIDNRMVKDNHQQGIERVKQRRGDMTKGQGGRMSDKGGHESNWKRGDQLTPRRG